MAWLNICKNERKPMEIDGEKILKADSKVVSYNKINIKSTVLISTNKNQWEINKKQKIFLKYTKK